MIESILTRLGFGSRPEPTLASLQKIYGRWGRRVPFDNVRKLIHVRSGAQGPLPGSTPADFARAIREEAARWAKVIRERKLEVN